MIQGWVARNVRDLRALPGDLRAAWRRHRWPGVREELLDRTLHRIHRTRRFYLFERDLVVPVTTAPDGVSARLLTPEDLPAFARVASARDVARAARMLERGRECMAAWAGGAIVGWVWMCPRMEADLEYYPLPLPPGTVYFMDLYVLPGWRRSGLGVWIGLRARALCLERGYRSGWRLIETTNEGALRTFLKTATPDVRLVGVVRARKLLHHVRMDIVQPTHMPDWWPIRETAS